MDQIFEEHASYEFEFSQTESCVSLDENKKFEVPKPSLNLNKYVSLIPKRPGKQTSPVLLYRQMLKFNEKRRSVQRIKTPTRLQSFLEKVQTKKKMMQLVVSEEMTKKKTEILKDMPKNLKKNYLMEQFYKKLNFLEHEKQVL